MEKEPNKKKGKNRKYDNNVYEDPVAFKKMYHVQYYKNNCDAILNQQKIKAQCKECGAIVRKTQMDKHKQTKKHITTVHFMSQKIDKII